MKKIYEFIAPVGELQITTTDWTTNVNFRIEPGRWEIYVDNVGNPRQIVLKAKFQEPSFKLNEGTFFLGGKL